MKTVVEKLKESPFARAALVRGLKVAAGAGAGALLGYRARGRPGIRRGAKVGAVAGLMFERKLSMQNFHHGGPRVALSAPDAANLIGVPPSALPALVRAGVSRQPTS